MTDTERQEILAWILAEHRAGHALNLHAVKSRRPDLLERVYGVRPFWGWWQAIREAGLDYAELKVDLKESVVCRICGAEGKQLSAHLDRRHGIRVAEYRERFPGAETASETHRASMMKDGGNHLLPHWEPLYSDEYMMDRTWRYHLLGYPLRTTWVCEHDHNLWQHIHRNGITWESFVTGLGIPYPEARVSRAPALTREEVLDGLHTIHRDGGKFTTITRLEKEHSLLAAGVRRYFQTLEEGLTAAGLPLPNRPTPLGRDLSPDELLDELRSLAAAGIRITADGIHNGLKRKDLHLAIERTGGYPAIRERLGLAKPPALRSEPTYSREEVVAALRERAAKGTLLTLRSLQKGTDANPQLVRSAKRHFPVWRDLLQAAGLEVEHHAKPRARRRREDLIAALRQHHDAGESLDGRTMKNDPVARKLFQQGCRLFQHWEAAVEAAGFPVEMADSRKAAQQALALEIRARFPSGEVPTLPAIKKNPETLDLYRRAAETFHSWKAAIRVAGLAMAKPKKPIRTRIARDNDTRGEGTHPKAASPKAPTSAFGRVAKRSRKKAQRQAVIDAIRKRHEANQPLLLRLLRRDPTTESLYREARKFFRSWKEAVREAGCAPAPSTPLPKSKLVEELERDYPIPEDMYEPSAPGKRRVWRRMTEDPESPPNGAEESDPAAMDSIGLPPKGGMPRGWRIPKRGEKQRHTPSKAAIRKKRKKGRK